MSVFGRLKRISTLALRYAGAGVMVDMPGRTYAGPFQSLTPEEEESRTILERHVRVLASDIGDRNIRTIVALEEAANYIEAVFNSVGYDVTAQSFETGGYTVRNLEVVRPGQTRPDEIIVVGAHYDTVFGCPGANDNASGVAALLELARLLGDAPLAHTLRFVAFVNEEPPYFLTDQMGSRVYARQAARRGDNIVTMYSLETMGYYRSTPNSQRYPFPFNLFYPDRGDFIGFVGNLSSRKLVRRSIELFRRQAQFPSQGAAAPGWIPGVFWSDHASFWKYGYPGLMITDTALFRYPYYHTPMDTAEKVDYPRLARVVRGVAQLIGRLARRSAE